MKLRGQIATVLLTEDGRSVLKLIGVDQLDATLLVVIEEQDELGLWLRLPIEDQMHFFLLRWDYIVGVDVSGELGKIAGLKG